MSDSPKPKRRYNSTRRQEQMRQTRRQIAEAARQLFTERGYAGATIDAIAREAEVAPETVYAIFGSKHKILWHLMDISIGGDDAPVPLMERPEPQAVLRETDQRQLLGRFARDITQILTRAAAVFEMLRSAGEIEPELADLFQRMTQERSHNMEMVVQTVAANGPLREGIDTQRAVGTVWTLTSPQVFLLLTRDRGWSPPQYADWLADSLTRLLLP